MTDLRAELQAALGATYTIERELGGGGMSRVFVAEDARLGRRVVIKVLSPELASGLSVERFEREIFLAARLQHPHIVPLLSAGEVVTLPYYTMPFIDGASLRERFDAGLLTPAESLGVLRDVARALAYAHRQGVVHRDIKPENILLSDGAAVVTDFGVARALRAAFGTKGLEALTQMGSQLGTPAYMSPEQAAGDPDVDLRADLYSFGVMAYELLAGEHPFAGCHSAQQFIVAHLTEEPEPLMPRAGFEHVTLGDVVMRCLQKNPESRPDSANALLEALDSAPLRSTSGSSTGTASASLRHPPPPAVAVLPFVNLSSDKENEYLSDGITDEIIGTLGRLRSVRVAGRGSCFALKGTGAEPRTVGQKLGVTFVLEGSVRRVGDRIRVQAELVNAADGFQIWAERYDRDMSDIFAVQDDIAQAIAAALSARLTTPPAAVAATPAPPSSGEAYRLYLLSLHTLRNQQAPEALRKALRFADEALALDPSVAGAHLARALVFNNFAVYNIELPRTCWVEARASLDRALALDPADAEAWAIAGQVAYTLDLDWPAAERAFARGLESGPDNPVLLVRAGIFHRLMGDDAKALDLTRHAVKMDPLSVWTWTIAASNYRLLRRFDDAEDACRRALDLNPHHGLALTMLGGALLPLGRADEALEAYERAVALTGGALMPQMGICAAHAARGDRAQAESALARMQSDASPHPAATWIGLGLAAIGRTDEAYPWLERAFAQREIFATWLPAEPYADVLRGDPRFTALLRQMRIPGA